MNRDRGIIILLVVLLLATAETVWAQGFSFNCAKDTALPGCPANLCFTLKTKIPDPHRSSTNYAVNAPGIMPTCLLASNNPGIPGAPTTLSVDDRYSPAFAIGFPFIFFGTPYNNLVAASNGYISFDVSMANTFSHWNIINGGNPQNLPSTFYDRAIIMGPYHDIDVGITTSPNRRISYLTTGLAPYRKWILNYYKIPLFSAACNNLFENTHQIILYESTGIIDINIFDKQICTGWNQGRAMVGVQNFNQNVGVMAPGRFATDAPWGSVGMNESWRFIPIGGTPLFRRVELYDMSGNLVSTGTTVQLPNGDREASFPNICPPTGGTTQYVIKAFYDKIDNPSQEIFGMDTIGVNRARSLVGTPNTYPASCGNNNGTIRVTNTNGGSGTYQFSLDGVNWQSDSTFSNLSFGNYTVYIRDVPVSCNSNYTVTVGNIANLSATTTNNATTCATINNGSITVTACTGLPPFTYSLDGGTYQSGPLPYTFTNLAPGAHTLIVRDANNCVTNTSSITIATGTGITVNTSGSSSACGTPTGSIVVTPSGGVGPYTYQLGTGTPQTSATVPFTYSGLAPGNYTVTVTDNAGCARTVTRTVTTSTTISVSITTSPASCPTASNGSVRVIPTNGSSPYQFSIDGGPFFSAPLGYNFTNIAPGTHSIMVIDALGCTRNTTVTIGTGGSFTGAATPGATSCSGSATGTITVTPSGGAGPYSYIVDRGTPVLGTTVPFTITGVPAGIHSVVIVDAAGCQSNTMNVIVTSGPPFLTTATQTDALCNGSPTGTITVTPPASGTPPFNYSLDGVNWQSNNVFNGVTAGNYTVYYNEAGGCQGTLPITVGESSSMVTSAAPVATRCNGETNGVITVSATGGLPPYQYSIDGGTTWQNSNVFNTGAGAYTVLVRDANNCRSPIPVTVTEPAVLTASAVNGAASCNGGNDGTITVTASGGNLGYTYSLDGTSFQPSNSFNVGPGAFTVTVKDNLGCTTSFPTTVALNSNFSLTPQRDTIMCEGNSVQLALTSNATQYAWSPGTGLSSATVANPVASPTVSTQYIVTATLGRCSGYDTVMVNVRPAPVPNAGPDGFICFGQTYQLQGSGGMVYSWSPAVGLNNSTIPNPVTSSGRDITYSLSILADANGCRSLVTDQVYIDVTPPLKVKTIPYDTIVSPGAQIQLLAIPSDTDVVRYAWTPATGLNDATLPNPVATAGLPGDVVTYRVLTSTRGGCQGEGLLTLRVYKGPDIYVPSGFTPNSDGRNDRLTPFPVGIKEFNYFRVFNRWGQMVFTTSRLHEGWDGKLRGQDQPSGMYVWMLECTTIDGRTIRKQGTFALIR